MPKILNYLWRLWLLLLAGTLLILFFLPVYILSLRRRWYRGCYFFIRLWCILVFYGMGFRFGFKNISNKIIERNRQYIVIANHTSMADILLMPILFPHHPICFVGKKELVKIPIFGTIYKRICVMVDRGSAKSRADVYRRCAERMAGGDSIVIFPEGGVPDDTSIILDNFKDGAFTLASKHGLPLIVISILKMKELFPFDNSKGRPGKAEVVLNDILEPAPAEELKLFSHNEIKKTLKQYYFNKI